MCQSCENKKNCPKIENHKKTVKPYGFLLAFICEKHAWLFSGKRNSVSLKLSRVLKFFKNTYLHKFEVVYKSCWNICICYDNRLGLALICTDICSGMISYFFLFYFLGVWQEPSGYALTHWIKHYKKPHTVLSFAIDHWLMTFTYLNCFKESTRARTVKYAEQCSITMNSYLKGLSHEN